MTRQLSARARLTLVYTALFVTGGAILLVITYVLVSHSLHASPPIATTSTRRAVGHCIEARGPSVSVVDAKRNCSALFASGVRLGATAQRSRTLSHLLTYSLLALVGVLALAVAAGWILAGRILRPIHRVTAAARAASEDDLSQRIELQGPRDEVRELADTFDAMLERLQDAFTSQRQFIANASHEMRTPLTVMRTAIDVVLAKRAATREELTSMAVEIRDAVEHVERLIQALLTLARSAEAASLNDWVDLAVLTDDARGTLAADGITTNADLLTAPVRGDAVLLERLVHNLLDNAHRYNDVGGSVSISTDTDHVSSILRIINTGPLVEPDQVARLFQPFTRLVDRTRGDGYGLGLALVASIAAAHHGTVHASALAAGGLDVSVRLPRADAEDTDLSAGLA